MRTLVVVDMQNGYVTRGAPYMKRVIELVLRFRANGWPIILVEFEGETIKSVRNTVKNYDNCATVQKHRASGGKAVLEACSEYGYPTDFVVCGVSVCCCVRSTANTLVEEHPVEVAVDCTDAYEEEQWGGDNRVKANKWFTKEAAA